MDSHEEAAAIWAAACKKIEREGRVRGSCESPRRGRRGIVIEACQAFDARAPGRSKVKLAPMHPELEEQAA